MLTVVILETGTLRLANANVQMLSLETRFASKITRGLTLSHALVSAKYLMQSAKPRTLISLLSKTHASASATPRLSREQIKMSLSAQHLRSQCSILRPALADVLSQTMCALQLHLLQPLCPKFANACVSQKVVHSAKSSALKFATAFPTRTPTYAVS